VPIRSRIQLISQKADGWFVLAMMLRTGMKGRPFGGIKSWVIGCAALQPRPCNVTQLPRKHGNRARRVLVLQDPFRGSFDELKGVALPRSVGSLSADNLGTTDIALMAGSGEKNLKGGIR